MKHYLKKFALVRFIHSIPAWIRVLLIPVWPIEYEDVAFHNDENWKSLVKEIIKKYDLKTVYETGTFKGSTALWLYNLGVLVLTCEINPLYYREAKARLYHTQVGLFLESSVDFIGRIYRKETPLLYLDAHWGKSPLAMELQLCNKFDKAIIMIDDFDANGLPHDEGVDLDVVKNNLGGKYSVYYPNYNAPRGYCVIFKGFEPINSPNISEVTL